MNEIFYNFEFVSVYILGKGADLSVGSPFCRNTPNKTYAKKDSFENDFTEQTTLSKEDLKTLEHLEENKTYNTFMNNYYKILNAIQAKCIGISENKELETKLNSIFTKIESENKINDRKLFNQRKQSLLRITKGALKNTFTLDKIKAAIYNYQ